MALSDLQQQCERGQEHLVATRYRQAEAVLSAAEQQAWTRRDWDALARLYMPLQEARRQVRQRCGEGVVCLDLLAEGPGDDLAARHVLENYPHAQLLVAGWGSLAPAAHVRQMAAEMDLYVETFLAAVYPVTGGRAVLIAPLPETVLPTVCDRSIDQLRRDAPAHCLVMDVTELPHGAQPGTADTFGRAMRLWEHLHAPFLAAADAQSDAIAKMQAYRHTIRVDDACELAHQRLSDVARALARQGSAPAAR